MGGSASFSTTFGAQTGLAIIPILCFGSEAQQHKYLPRIVSGDIVGAYCLSEAGSGSDALGARAKAVRQPDGSWLLNGEKMWKGRGGPGAAASLVSATKNSMNTVFAQLMVRLGPDAVAKTAVDMGVKSLEGQDPRCAWVLGSGEVSVLDMAAGYSTLANEGIAKSPIVVTRVEFPDGTVKRYEPEQHRVLTSEQAGRVTFALQQVIDGGTGKQANIGKPAAGKTGTTQQNVDGWFVGYGVNLRADGAFGKDGADPGVATVCRYVPATDTTAVFLANVGWDDVDGMGELWDLLASAAFDE